MTVELRAITLDECQQVRLWRNAPDVLPMLRTGMKTASQQATFFRDVVSNPNADHKYFAVVAVDRAGTETFIGMGGLTYLSRVPGEAEISLILGPEFRGKRFGVAAVGALLAEATRLSLCVVIGECYRAGAVSFWQSLSLAGEGRRVGRWVGESYRFWWIVNSNEGAA